MSILFSLYIEINSNNIENICTSVSSMTTIPDNIMNEEKTINGNKYILNDYTTDPIPTTEQYTPPSQSVALNFAYYNVSPFIATISSGYSPSQYTSSSKSYEVYMISYSVDNISTINEHQIYDIIYLYSYLSSTFSSAFLSSTYYENGSKVNITSLIKDYCNLTGNMGSGLCNSTSGIGESLPVQSLVNQSPCTNPYSTCYNAWDSYCFTSGNYDSPECLQYYSNSYENNQLNANIKNGLLNICSSIYNSNTTPPENFWEVCSCFLPENVYTDFLTENNVTGISQGAQQCWYYPCISASVQPEASATCPSSTVVSCIQKQYLTLEDTGGSITDDNIKTQQAISNCQATNSGNGSSPSTSSSTPPSSTPSSPTSPPVPSSNSSNSPPSTPLSSSSSPLSTSTSSSSSSSPLSTSTSSSSSSPTSSKKSSKTEKTSSNRSDLFLMIFIPCVVIIVGGISYHYLKKGVFHSTKGNTSSSTGGNTSSFTGGNTSSG